jgi:hypothetical protein
MTPSKITSQNYDPPPPAPHPQKKGARELTAYSRKYLPLLKAKTLASLHSFTKAKRHTKHYGQFNNNNNNDYDDYYYYY